jgi:serine/threonine protein kinase
MSSAVAKAVQTSVARTTIGGYRVFEKIGKGATGTVFKALDPATGDIVAIKLLASELVNNEWRMRFAQECQVARMLHHPHIVRVLDFGLDGSKAYLVMEYVDGASLGQRLEDGGRLSEEEAVRLIRQVGQALHWAHQRKLVHRDVKPDNILVDSAGQAKLADLGLAKDLEGNFNLTHTNCTLGTPKFMAPEQFVDSKRADALCDLYSLAATLYMLVTGQLPFDARGPVDVYKKKKINDIEPPRLLATQLSAQLNDVILRGLRADRGERPPSVLDFLNALPGNPAEASAPASTDEKASPTTVAIVEVPRPGGGAVSGATAPGLAPAPRLDSRWVPNAAQTGSRTAPSLPWVLLMCAVSLLPIGVGVASADRFFADNLAFALLSVLVGLAVTGFALWLCIRRLTGLRGLDQGSDDELRTLISPQPAQSIGPEEVSARH